MPSIEEAMELPKTSNNLSSFANFLIFLMSVSLRLGFSFSKLIYWSPVAINLVFAIAL
jgi:hypothetical protein